MICSLQENACVRDRSTVGSLLVRTSSSAASESSRYSQLSFCLLEWNSASAVHPQNERRASTPPWTETFRQLCQSSESGWWIPMSPDYMLFSSISSLFSGFFQAFPPPVLSLLSRRRAHETDAEEAAEWSEPLRLPLRLSLSLSASLAFTLPSTCPLPSSHCTYPPFRLLSPPLLPSHTHTHRHKRTSIAMAFNNRCRAIGSRVSPKGSPPLRETNNAEINTSN